MIIKYLPRVEKAESSKWCRVREVFRPEKGRRLPVELMRSSLRDRYPKRCLTNASEPMRKIINQWRGCIAMLMTWKISLVSMLWCVVSCKYEMKLSRHKNFSRAWIDGSTNHTSSNITDHATSKQPTCRSAMMYCHKDQAKSRNEAITSYSPIACL